MQACSYVLHIWKTGQNKRQIAIATTIQAIVRMPEVAVNIGLKKN